MALEGGTYHRMAGFPLRVRAYLFVANLNNVPNIPLFSLVWRWDMEQRDVDPF